MSLLIGAALGGYLIGTISFTRIVGRIVLRGVDLATTEYDVPGTEEKWVYRGVSATSVIERAGWKWGVVVILLDGAKAFVPTLVLRLTYPDSSAYLVAAVAVIVGHVWPVWWRFVGGRGQSSLVGALLAIDVLAIPVAALAGAIVGIAGFTSVYLARNMGPLLLIPWFGIAGWGPRLWFAAAVNVVYWIAVRADLSEETAARHARGINGLPYGERLRLAWHEFFLED